MNRIYKKLLMLFLAFFVCVTLCAEKTLNWVDVLKEKVGEQPCPGEKGDVSSIRENKKPGEQYLHHFSASLDGRATARSSRIVKWWQTKSEVNFRHETQLIVRESIVSSQEELNNGIVRSKYEVLKLSENLISAKGGVKFGPINSVSTLKFLSEFGREYGSAIKATGETLVAAGLAALIAPEPLISKTTAIITLSAGGVLWVANECLALAPEDGYVSLSKEFLASHFPDYQSFVAKLNEWEGSVAYSTWKCGEGYTKIQITESRASNEDQELIAKLIYRTNPAISWRICPKNSGETKTLDASEIGGIIFTKAVDFDRVSGQIQVKNRGIGAESQNNEENCDIIEVLNENAKDKKITSEDIRLEEIGIVENGSNVISLKCRAKGVESVSVSFVPHGSFFVVKRNSEKGIPSFVRKASLEGNLDARVENEKGWLQEINMDERDVTVKLHYQQIFLGRKR